MTDQQTQYRIERLESELEWYRYRAGMFQDQNHILKKEQEYLRRRILRLSQEDWSAHKDTIERQKAEIKNSRQLKKKIKALGGLRAIRKAVCLYQKQSEACK